MSLSKSKEEVSVLYRYFFFVQNDRDPGHTYYVKIVVLTERRMSFILLILFYTHLYSDRVIRIFGILKLLNIDLINLTQFTHGYRINMLRNVLIYSKRALTVDWYIQRRQ